jgi:hypothetical protein
MNLILFEKISNSDKELKEYLSSKSDVIINVAYSKEEVIKLLNELEKIDWLIFLNVAIPSDLGLVQYTKANFPETKIIFYASSMIKQSIEIIRNSDILVIDNNFEKLKKIHEVINSDTINKNIEGN